VAEQPVWTDELLESPHEAADKAGRVRRMFDAIAPTYERVNRLFSAGRDAYWRRKACALADVRPDDRVLDVACGTGDFARAFIAAGARRVVGIDFAHQMVVQAATHSACRRSSSVLLAEGDALRLPFADASFAIVSCAFGVRNFADLDAGLSEMRRVLGPGGRMVILEFTRPPNAAVRRVYEWYTTRVMPRAAGWISGDRCGAYRYLPRSVVSFLDAVQMCERMRRCGLGCVAATPLTLGAVTVYVGSRD
jgi:demethylmenaquinone methyltransferase/2-methoxy-6-polyprenyl-1,4-benzoquinol methylase